MDPDFAGLPSNYNKRYQVIHAKIYTHSLLIKKGDKWQTVGVSSKIFNFRHLPDVCLIVFEFFTATHCKTVPYKQRLPVLDFVTPKVIGTLQPVKP